MGASMERWSNPATGTVVLRQSLGHCLVGRLVLQPTLGGGLDLVWIGTELQARFLSLELQTAINSAWTNTKFNGHGYNKLPALSIEIPVGPPTFGLGRSARLGSSRTYWLARLSADKTYVVEDGTELFEVLPPRPKIKLSRPVR